MISKFSKNSRYVTEINVIMYPYFKNNIMLKVLYYTLALKILIN